MGAAYDSYDYQNYWLGRQYEHESEVTAIREFLKQIPRIKKIIEIGGGYGRMIPYYAFRAKKVVLTDPSAKELSQAKSLLIGYPNVSYVQSRLEVLSKKFRAGSFDLAIMIRVLHHMPDIDLALKNIERLITPGGYLILEFANKIHFKSVIKNMARGDITFAINTTPEDRRSEKMKKKKTLPFLNYHPDIVRESLEKHGFNIVEMRSVSNVRSPFLKKYLPISLLLLFEGLLQKALSYVYFGPSIFVLARKKG